MPSIDHLNLLQIFIKLLITHNQIIILDISKAKLLSSFDLKENFLHHMKNFPASNIVKVQIL